MQKYALPELPYDLGALEPHYSGALLELHHGKHHAAYVTDANATIEKMAEARAKGDFSTIGQLEKNLAFHVSGHVMHSLFWKNMSPDGGGRPDGALGDTIDEHFGTFEGFQAQMNHAANMIQGSGWAALAWEPVGGRMVVEQVHDHQNNVCQGSIPLLVLDMWEHAFYLQYKDVKGDFVKAFWNIVNWADVGARLESVRGVNICL